MYKHLPFVLKVLPPFPHLLRKNVVRDLVFLLSGVQEVHPNE